MSCVARVHRFAGTLTCLAFVASCSTSPMIPAATLSELAPSGTLRVGINYGNTVLVQRNTVTGELNGLAPDLARELARRAGVPVVLVPYDTAGKMADAVKAGAWDVAFLAVDPQRAADIEFTAPYLEIEGAYMVPAGSKIASNDEVDREGVRIAVGLKS
ncbi:MAG: transporter substrate-binding domain-containing protein, partial [Betaproteobacteria bacterium]|nr:transporter substrate-binding domain-containing protein [Betaproteobacteria bacterium]